MSAPPPILVTGAAGQVGRELIRIGVERGLPVIGFDREGLDITDPKEVRRVLQALRPGALVNAAAYTAVDRAEEEPDLARAVNAGGPAHLAAACAEQGIPLVHLSTDYVFDGQASVPYREVDPIGPVNTYGWTKWEGEQAVRGQLAEHLILRTSWVFAPEGTNFITAIARLAREREVLEVVDDQWGSPTPATAVAAASLDALSAAQTGGGWGTYHFGGVPHTSRYLLACSVLENLRETGPVACRRIVPARTSAFPTPATRPAFSALDSSRIKEVLGVAPPFWEPATRDLLMRVKETLRTPRN